MKRMFLFLAAMFFVILPVRGESCEGLSDLDCKCSLLPESKNLYNVECQISPELTFAVVMRKLAESSISINKLKMTRCKMPVVLLEPLPKLKVFNLEITKCELNRVDEKAFDELAEDLQDLSLAHNNLTRMPFLGKLLNLKVLRLGNNRIRDIPEKSFEGLKNLRTLRLSHNNICSLSANALGDARRSVQILDLGYNCFTAIPAMSIRNSVNLSHLGFSGNQITDINYMVFMNLPSLIDLWLNENRISQISINAFMNVPNLQHVILRDNLLSVLEPATLHTFRNAKVLDLSGNNLTKVPNFKDNLNLVDLRLNNNKIKFLDTLTFTGMPNINIINLHNNEISNIYRNTFDNLNNLTTLILSQNALSFIERHMFDGASNLQTLSLGNNSITQLDGSSFMSVPNLLVLDLSGNKLTRIEKKTFFIFKSLNFLDLSNNAITGFDTESFKNPVGTILLHGNSLNCADKSINWFINYLLRAKVRTFLSNQPDIVCATPPEYENIRLKDLMMKKANDSMQAFGNILGGGPPGKAQANANLLSQILPAFSSSGQNGNVFKALTQAVPSLRNVPGINILNLGGVGAQRANTDPRLNSAIEKFAEPIMKFATGNQPRASDVSQLLKSIPELVVNIPGFGDVDITKLRPDVIEHVLKGGEIPGISREVLDKIVKQYMERLYYSAAKAQGHQPVGVPEENPEKKIDPRKYLLPLTELPQQMITSVMSGKSLPYLTDEQTQTVKDYYTQQIPLLDNSNGTANLTALLSPRVLQMLKLMPRGYNFSQISPEVFQSILNGTMPNFAALPADLQQHMYDNLDKLVIAFGETSDGPSLKELLKDIPKIDKSELSTFSPYDINKIDAELVGRGDMAERAQASATARQAKLITGIALAFFAFATLIILFGIYIYTKRKQQMTREKIAVAMNSSAGSASRLTY